MHREVGGRHAIEVVPGHGAVGVESLATIRCRLAGVKRQAYLATVGRSEAESARLRAARVSAPVDHLRGQGKSVELPDPPVAAQPGHRRGQRLRQGPGRQVRLDRGQLGLPDLQRRPVVGHGAGQRRIVEALRGQPLPVRRRPVAAVPPDAPVAHQHRCQSLLRPLPVAQHRRPGTHQIPDRLLGHARHPDRGQLAGPMQPGQPDRIPPIRLHPLGGSLGISDGATTSQATPARSAAGAAHTRPAPPRGSVAGTGRSAVAGHAGVLRALADGAWAV
jgi:hypothetical protein